MYFHLNQKEGNMKKYAIIGAVVAVIGAIATIIYHFGFHLIAKKDSCDGCDCQCDSEKEST